MTVHPGLCRTCSETTLLVFPRGGSNDLYIFTEDNNTRVLFERVLSSGQIPPEKSMYVFQYRYENLPLQYAEIFSAVKIKKSLEKKTPNNCNIFAQNIDCFGSKIRNIGIPLYAPGLLYKNGV